MGSSSFVSTISINNQQFNYFDLKKSCSEDKLKSLPFSLKVLLENLLRHFDGKQINDETLSFLNNWDAKAKPKNEITFMPSRVILQDFTGVPAVVDLATMRDAMKDMGGDPKQINPLIPVELVIDHSVMVDHFGNSTALQMNTEIEYERNRERYTFLRWGQNGFSNFKVVPPGTGIVHQVNLEYLARGVFNNENTLYPDTLVGTDSHTTMINGLGILGWGVGGIEAEAAMLGQPIPMLIPQVVGFKLTGSLNDGVTATDLVLQVVEMLRKEGVVGKFVEFFGDGLDSLPLADRATIANMAPEYGATCGIFPVDEETLKFYRLSGKSEEQIETIKQYYKSQSMFRDQNTEDATYSSTVVLNLSDVEPCIAGPKRPQDRITLRETKSKFNELLNNNAVRSFPVKVNNKDTEVKDGAVVIAAITSCTNTSNPSVMIAAGLVAKKAAALGVNVAPWVKTSLAPGSKVVTEYLEKSGLLKHLEVLGFNVVGYGCTTCIGNSGPLDENLSSVIKDNSLASCAVLSGNRNFEGRVHPLVKHAYLASPPLVVAYAIAGTMDINLQTDPIAKDKDGNDVFFKDIWPSTDEVNSTLGQTLTADIFKKKYSDVFEGDESWRALPAPDSDLYSWDESTYVKKPTFFDGITAELPEAENIENARIVALLGDSITTDHISPAGNIPAESPAGLYLKNHGVAPKDFNSYGSRRGNHEVMIRGTFGNIRLRNNLAPGTEGGWTKHVPSGDITSIFDASERYAKEKTPLVIFAGSEYGTGSSRDWAAKGTRLLGIKAVVAVSFERIHRSNLIGMGVLPLQFKEGDSYSSLEITGEEEISINLSDITPGGNVDVIITRADGSQDTVTTLVRIDTPKELEYFKNGGILHYVLRQLK
jgi:aconitate hydratase